MIEEIRKTVSISHDRNRTVKLDVSEICQSGANWIKLTLFKEGDRPQEMDISDMDDLQALIEMLLQYSDRIKGVSSYINTVNEPPGDY